MIETIRIAFSWLSFACVFFLFVGTLLHVKQNKFANIFEVFLFIGVLFTLYILFSIVVFGKFVLFS